MRAAFESGDRSEARSRRDGLERQSKELAKRDKEFEKELHAAAADHRQPLGGFEALTGRP
jgi:hypothetical protein